MFLTIMKSAVLTHENCRLIVFIDSNLINIFSTNVDHYNNNFLLMSDRSCFTQISS